MRYQPIYLPSGRKKPPVGPFRSKKEAWDWIIERCKKCPIKNNPTTRCDSCEAEWDVEQVP